jgi:hypothetical protein
MLGTVVQSKGLYEPLSITLSFTIAAFGAFNFAELVGCFTKSAGEAIYEDKGFNFRHFAVLIGLLVVAFRTILSATIFSGYVA